MLDIFIKTVVRQPIRNLVLLLLVGAAVFSVVLRASEYIILRSELNEIEGFYRSIGYLSSNIEGNQLNFDDMRWQEIITQSPYVDFADIRRPVIGEAHVIIGTDII